MHNENYSYRKIKLLCLHKRLAIKEAESISEKSYDYCLIVV